MTEVLGPDNQEMIPDDAPGPFSTPVLTPGPFADPVQAKSKIQIVRGRYKLPDPRTGDYRMFSRASTIAKTLESTYHLDRWKDRKLAKGLSMRPDLVDLAGSMDEDDKDGFADLVKTARDTAGANQGSNHGTAIHSLAERVDRGECLPQGTRKSNADTIRAYQNAMALAQCQVYPEYIERVVLTYIGDIPVVGRLDRVANARRPALLELLRPGPIDMIGDLKTGTSMLGELSFAIQLSIYAHASYLWDEDGERWVPIEDTGLELDKGVAMVMHVPSDDIRCDIQLVNIQEGWEYAHLAMDVRASQRNKNLTKLVVTASANRWMDVILRCSTKDELSEIWKEANQAGEWTSELEAAGLKRKALIESGKV